MRNPSKMRRRRQWPDLGPTSRSGETGCRGAGGTWGTGCWPRGEHSRRKSGRKEEEKRKAKEEEEKREYEEYLKLKESFVVEEEGVEEKMTEEESRSFLMEFLEFVKKTKVIQLEDLASHLGLRTQEAINRIQDLMADGTLTGVIDDRGKFIYITPEEMAAVAQYIKQRGRVSIAELVQASNSLINLQPDSQAVAPTVA
uniref:DDRGK domain-containing protein 1 n=1 Tax=Anser cygnoides TaxID=8845 RepID=A0A8B9DGH6_ANSCY